MIRAMLNTSLPWRFSSKGTFPVFGDQRSLPRKYLAPELPRRSPLASGFGNRELGAGGLFFICLWVIFPNHLYHPTHARTGHQSSWLPPDYAWLCKHAAAVLYGVGRRLDDAPELLFTLRGVDHLALIDQAVTSLPESAKAPPAATLSGDLSALFGIEISDGTEVAQVKPAKKPNKKKPQNTKGKVAQVVGRGAKPKKANKQPVKSKTAKKNSVLKSSGVKAGAKAGVVKASGKSTRTNDKTPSEKSKPTKKVRSGGKRIGR